MLVGKSANSAMKNGQFVWGGSSKTVVVFCPRFSHAQIELVILSSQSFHPDVHPGVHPISVFVISWPRPFYYNKYYKKTFNVKHYGVETNLALLSYIQELTKVTDGRCQKWFVVCCVVVVVVGWLLVVGCWLLVVGCLVVGCWWLVVGCWFVVVVVFVATSIEFKCWTFRSHDV